MEIKAKKSLGQNFLKDEQILSKIANSIPTTKEDLIIEIGPGTGALTKHLIKKDSYLIAYEIDTRLKPFLTPLLNNKTTIIYQDFLKANLEEDLKPFSYDNIYIIANIPYYITTPIIKRIITIPKLKSLTLLVQKEVAERLCASPNSKAYGSLTVYLNYYFSLNYLFTVKNTCFAPTPKVDSAVINLTKKPKNTKLIDEITFFNLISAAFSMKRKTLKNNLKNYNWLPIKKVLDKHHLPETIRAEEIPLDLFIELANSIFNYN